MRPVCITCVVLLILLVALPVQALESWALYDAFNGPLINPAKWFGNEPASMGAEAIRQIQTRRLRMFYRGYGGASSDTDETGSSLQLRFTNPGAVTAIKATVTVSNFQLTTCPANPAFGTRVQARLHGRFFNAGTPVPGNETDEVIASIRVVRNILSTDAPEVLRVRGTVSRCLDALCLTSEDLDVEVGTAAKGRPAAVSITWDPDNDRFIFQNGPTTANIVYPWSDTAPPAFSVKRLEVRTVVPNCTGSPRPSAFMDAFFDDAYVNASAASAAAPAGLTAPTPLDP